MKKIVAFILASCALPALAAAPFAAGNAETGKALYDRQCAACHVKMYGGDGSKIFTRADHRVKSASSLAQQITTCNANLGNQLFPEDEANLGAYLNKRYYKFK
jgi:mono/diheme cytochrome c family protein